jgi:hypothetical protein
MQVGLKKVALTIAIIGFVIFFGNIVLSANNGWNLLCDVAEMLLLFGTCCAFVTFLLQCESAAKSGQETQKNEP